MKNYVEELQREIEHWIEAWDLDDSEAFVVRDGPLHGVELLLGYDTTHERIIVWYNGGVIAWQLNCNYDAALLAEFIVCALTKLFG